MPTPSPLAVQIAEILATLIATDNTALILVYHQQLGKRRRKSRPGNTSVRKLFFDGRFTEPVLKFLRNTDVGKVKQVVLLGRFGEQWEAAHRVMSFFFSVLSFAFLFLFLFLFSSYVVSLPWLCALGGGSFWTTLGASFSPLFLSGQMCCRGHSLAVCQRYSLFLKISGDIH